MAAQQGNRYSVVVRKDIVGAVAFFAAAIAFGSAFLYIRRDKWQAEMVREEHRFRVAEANRRIAAGEQRLALAERAADAKDRRRFAEEAAAHFTFALEVNPGLADLYAARARSRALLGETDAAREDVARLKKLRPAHDWSDLERACATTP